jgi:hypothetical protein
MSILTAADATALAAIIEMVIRTDKVARVAPKGHYAEGDIIYGTARSLGDENGYFLTNKDDIRDAYLRVTTRGGMEAFWPVKDLVAEFNVDTFATYDWS